MTINFDDITRVQESPPGPTRVPTSRDQAYLIVLAGSAMGETYKLNRERTVIGRGQKAHVRMMDEGVSREHCEVRIEGGKMVLQDLDSTNGTFCRGARIETHELEDGDKILVGSGTVLKFTYHDSLDETFQRQMYESALRDDLTKTWNKKYFTDRLESEFAYAIRMRGPLALMVFDLDHFKDVNDTYGHPTGDYVLSEMAMIVSTLIRIEDVFARVGGEEFAVICRATDKEQCQAVAQRIRITIANHHFSMDGHTIPITTSAGISAIPDAYIRDAQALVAAADQALYQAKHEGRNRICVWQAKP